jgi:hypothetical protein
VSAALTSFLVGCLPDTMTFAGLRGTNFMHARTRLPKPLATVIKESIAKVAKHERR